MEEGEEWGLGAAGETHQCQETQRATQPVTQHHQSDRHQEDDIIPRVKSLPGGIKHKETMKTSHVQAFVTGSLCVTVWVCVRATLLESLTNTGQKTSIWVFSRHELISLPDWSHWDAASQQEMEAGGRMDGEMTQQRKEKKKENTTDWTQMWHLYCAADQPHEPVKVWLKYKTSASQSYDSYYYFYYVYYYF